MLLIQHNVYSQHNTNLIIFIIWLHASVSMQDTRLTVLSENSGLYMTHCTGTSMLFAAQPVQLEGWAGNFGETFHVTTTATA